MFAINKKMLKMRTESCRNCGKPLSVLKICQICKQPKQIKCEHCFKYVDDPIHSNCETISV